MQLTTTDLRAALERTLAHIESGSERVFEIEQDFYWHVPPEVRYDTYEPPESKALTIGQLSDDVERLRELVHGHKPPLGCDLIWLASLVRVVGEMAVE